MEFQKTLTVNNKENSFQKVWSAGIDNMYFATSLLRTSYTPDYTLHLIYKKGSTIQKYGEFHLGYINQIIKNIDGHTYLLIDVNKTTKLIKVKHISKTPEFNQNHFFQGSALSIMDLGYKARAPKMSHISQNYINIISNKHKNLHGFLDEKIISYFSKAPDELFVDLKMGDTLTKAPENLKPNAYNINQNGNSLNIENFKLQKHSINSPKGFISSKAINNAISKVVQKGVSEETRMNIYDLSWSETKKNIRFVMEVEHSNRSNEFMIHPVEKHLYYFEIIKGKTIIKPVDIALESRSVKDISILNDGTHINIITELSEVGAPTMSRIFKIN